MAGQRAQWAALSSRGRVRQLQPWAERVLDDLRVIELRGRPLPVAERHGQATTPLHQRVHHPASD